MFGKQKQKPRGYDLVALRTHPGANPDHLSPTGRAARYAVTRELFKMAGKKRVKTGEIRVITVIDKSRWLPHNGAREMARRVRQMEAHRG
jgi:hypothetical protein